MTERSAGQKIRHNNGDEEEKERVGRRGVQSQLSMSLTQARRNVHCKSESSLV